MNKVESFRCKIVSFDEISKWIVMVAKKIRERQCKPTVIVGLTRGGWIPARLLCDHLEVKKLYAVKTEHWGVTANPNGKAVLTQELNANIENESVLVVDDITDTGESLTLAMAHLSEMRPRELKSATLLHITHAKIEPDFYSVKVPEEKWTWFIFPWNLHEDLRTLLPKTLSEPKTVNQIRISFRNQFRVSVPEALLRMTLDDLAAKKMVHRSGKTWTKTD
jgi:hypoxanthine phosphoribosyltransferase